MNSFLMHKTVMVTGACGTIGSKLVEHLALRYRPREIVCIDNNESELFFLEQEMNARGKADFILADVRDKDKLTRCFRGADVVLHAAAFKHVIMCERSPFEAVQTNILGVRNVVHAAQEAKVSKVLFTSSDKAVNPTNVMGTSKLMGERLVTAANSLNCCDTVYSATRFGNVLGSRGSVIPIFRNQIRKGGPITLTDPEMTRFIMSLRQAVRLVLESCSLSCGGEVFITKMPVARIRDLAQVMIETLAPEYGHDPEKIETRVVGALPGEKLYEELMTEEEAARSWELENYYAVLPAFRTVYPEQKFHYPKVVSKHMDTPYNSRMAKVLTKEELLDFLTGNGLLLEGSADDHRSPHVPYGSK